jgi:hypothetical protein
LRLTLAGRRHGAERAPDRPRHPAFAAPAAGAGPGAPTRSASAPGRRRAR